MSENNMTISANGQPVKFDREIVISTGNSRKDLNWKRLTLKVSELYDRLRIPNRGVETLDEYVRMSKAKQDDLKDVGGFVAGSLNGGRRKANNVIARDVITLDFDNIPALGTDGILDTLNRMGINYCVYSTRKHAANAPRLRILVPTDRSMTVDEYEPCARRMAANIGIAMADPTTFEAGRLMYWPSTCRDSEYVYQTADAPFVTVDSLLHTYADWHDITQWPQVPGSFSYAKLAVKQGDPTEKDGVVGAFCRKYDVFRAMDELLPGIYAPCDNDSNRFTYALGSTTGGAVVYDEGKFMFSHHATDPCSNKLVNAFDLVRLHKYGDLDDRAADGTPNNRLPSYKAMCEYANGLDEVALELLQKRQAQAEADFAEIVSGSAAGEATQKQEDGAAENWMLKLKRDPQTGKIMNTLDNAVLIFDNDPRISGKFRMNTFAGRGEVLGALPWEKESEGTHLWRDSDSNALYWWMEKEWGWSSSKWKIIDAALDVHANLHAFNPVQTYLSGLKWDGTSRLDTLFIDYLGAEDSIYTRAVTRKAFTAAVARALKPGIKFDNMLILIGPQGVGKSTILDKMSRGWFNDSIRTFEGKAASELLQGVWIVEIAELDAFRRSEVSTVKQFLSLRTDRYRAAYGRNVKELPRNCVFFGTGNEPDFLKDATGNRRFWPIDVRMQEPTKSVFTDLTDKVIDQLWAEARFRFITGEQLYIDGEVAEMATQKQEEHREDNPYVGEVEEFIHRPIPDDWADWPVDRRRDFWAGLVKDDKQHLIDRKSVCVAEIALERYGMDKGHSQYPRVTDGIRKALRLLGCVSIGARKTGVAYGSQRSYNVP